MVDNIKIAAKRKGLSIAAVERLCGFGNGSISKWDASNPPLYKLKAVSETIGVPMEQLAPEMFPEKGKNAFEDIPKMKSVPLVGTIACGAPILAEENIEGFLSMPESINADFCLRCKGDSMINARIFDGDIVYIRQQPEVEDGQIAAVLVGEEATLKRVRLFQDHICLEPENPQYRPLVYWDADMASVKIIGKAVAFTSTIR